MIVSVLDSSQVQMRISLNVSRAVRPRTARENERCDVATRMSKLEKTQVTQEQQRSFQRKNKSEQEQQAKGEHFSALLFEVPFASGLSSSEPCEREADEEHACAKHHALLRLLRVRESSPQPDCQAQITTSNDASSSNLCTIRCSCLRTPKMPRIEPQETAIPCL